MAIVRIELPSRQVGILLAAVLVDEQRTYVTDFNPEWTEVTLQNRTEEELSKAEAVIRAHIEQIGHDIRINTNSLPCAYMPLLCSAVGEGEVRSVEELYHVDITFTSKYLPIRALQSLSTPLGSQSPLLCTIHLRDFMVSPQLSLPWQHCPQNGMPTPFNPDDSRKLEDLFQFGGQKVPISGNLCAVDFKDMTIRSVTSGEVESMQRFPSIRLPEHHIVMSIKGLESCVTDALSNLKARLDKSLKSLSIRVSQGFASQLQQQIINCCRQYCIQYSFSSVDAECVLKISGAEGYIEQVHARLCENVQMLEREFTAQFLATDQPSLKQDLVQRKDDIPRLWTRGQTADCVFVAVPPHSPEWNDIGKRMRETLPEIDIAKIDRVQNRILWDRYQLEGRHMSERNNNTINEKYLFHGTTKTDPYEIARSINGIDFRCSSRERKLMWGTGAYFAVKASYSNAYSYKLRNHKRQMMLVSILTGISYRYAGQKNPDLTRPPERHSGMLYDTVYGESGGSGVYVVYDHLKSCPAYIITYVTIQ